MRQLPDLFNRPIIRAAMKHADRAGLRIEALIACGLSPPRHRVDRLTPPLCRIDGCVARSGIVLVRKGYDCPTSSDLARFTDQTLKEAAGIYVISCVVIVQMRAEQQFKGPRGVALRFIATGCVAMPAEGQEAAPFTGHPRRWFRDELQSGLNTAETSLCRRYDKTVARSSTHGSARCKQLATDFGIVPE